jgi:selenocysteine lyase/cysteine desulfurase
MILDPQRELFDIPHDIGYFNCAYNSPLLNESQRRLLSGISSKSRPWERTAASFFADAETIRTLASRIFGGDSDGYAIVPAASYGLSTAARAIEPHLHAGDTILVVAEEFPSNVLPWRRIAKERDARVKTVPTPEDGNWTHSILENLDKDTKVVALSTCHWTNGAYIDLVAIRRECSETGTIMVVDATQSLGATPFLMDMIKPDFLVAAGYKWLLCPYGFSLMYVSEQWRDSRPLEETWLARENAQDFASLVNYCDTYLPGARRFDVGETCTATILPGAIAALEQIEQWGVQQISDYISRINNKIAAHVQRLGFRLPVDSQRSPHMFGATLPECYKGNLVSALRDRNLFVSQRGSSIRFAPHVHVNDHDVQRLLDAITDIVKQEKQTGKI